MRRVIFVIIFVLLGVLCLSSTIRLSDELYEFFYEDNSSGTSSNSSNNNSGPNDTQSPGDNTGSEDNTGSLVPATLYQRTEERFGFNYRIDTSYYVKQNEYYYYSLEGDENKFIKSDVILDGNLLYTDCGDFVYVRVEESIPQDDLKSVIIDMLSIDENFSSYKLSVIADTPDFDLNITDFLNILFDDVRYLYSFGDFLVIFKAKSSILTTTGDGYRWYARRGSVEFGLTTFDYNAVDPDVFSDCYKDFYSMAN